MNVSSDSYLQENKFQKLNLLLKVLLKSERFIEEVTCYVVETGTVFLQVSLDIYLQLHFTA